MSPNEPTKESNAQTEAISQSTGPTLSTEKKGGFSIKTFLLIFFLGLITIGLLAIALIPQKPAPETTLPIISNPLQTTLTILSTPTPQATPSSYMTDVLINTGQNRVTNVQLELSFDPNILTKVNIEPGDFFINPNIVLKNIDTKNGRITYVVASEDGAGVTGQEVLAKISFTTLKKGTPVNIEFLPKTKVSAEGISQSVLKSSVGASFSLGAVPTFIISPTATSSGK